jgi:hypothetical protein
MTPEKLARLIMLLTREQAIAWARGNASEPAVALIGEHGTEVLARCGSLFEASRVAGFIAWGCKPNAIISRRSPFFSGQNHPLGMLRQLSQPPGSRGYRHPVPADGWRSCGAAYGAGRDGRHPKTFTKSDMRRNIGVAPKRSFSLLMLLLSLPLRGLLSYRRLAQGYLRAAPKA